MSKILYTFAMNIKNKEIMSYNGITKLKYKGAKFSCRKGDYNLWKTPFDVTSSLLNTMADNYSPNATMSKAEALILTIVCFIISVFAWLGVVNVPILGLFIFLPFALFFSIITFGGICMLFE